MSELSDLLEKVQIYWSSLRVEMTYGIELYNEKSYGNVRDVREILIWKYFKNKNN